MKKLGTIILSAALAAAFIAGCSNQITNSEPSVSITESTTAVETSEETTVIDEDIPQTFEEYYGKQLAAFMDIQYYYEGEPVMKQEANFYFIDTFRYLSGYANMGYYPATALGSIDLAAEFEGDEYKTYGDFLRMNVETSIEMTCIMVARAEKEGIKLSEEGYKQIDAMLDAHKSEAVTFGLSYEDYLLMMYGPGMDEATLRKVAERYYLVDEYTQAYCEKYQFTDAEKKVPNVRYALFYAPESAGADAKKAALAAATEMKDKCKTIDDLTPLAQSAYENGIVYDQGDLPVPKGQMVAKFEEWAYGKNREVGELDVIFAPEYGYFVVGYLGLVDQSQDDLNNIALKALSTDVIGEIDAKKHGFHTDDEFPEVPEGPTPTPVPTSTPSPEDTFNIDATVPTSATEIQQGPMTAMDVMIVVFFTLGGVAILGVIVILVMQVVKKKNGASEASEEPVKANKPKISKLEGEDEDDEDSEEDEESDEEETEEDEESDDSEK